MQWCWVYTTSVFSHWRGHRSGPYYYDITILRIRNNIQSNSLYILRLSFFFSNMCTPFWTLSYLSFILQLWPLNTSYTRLSMFQLARLGGTVGRLPQVPSEDCGAASVLAHAPNRHLLSNTRRKKYQMPIIDKISSFFEECTRSRKNV